MSEGSSFPASDERPMKKQKLNEPSPPFSRILDSRVLEGPLKKMSPLKHVSPILRKYSTQRHGKSVKGIRPKTKSIPQPAVSVTESLKEELPSSPPQSELPIEPDVLNDLSIVPDNGLSPETAHTHAIESFPEDPREPSADTTSSPDIKSDLIFKDVISPPTNQSSKIAKQTQPERKRSRSIKKKNRLQKELRQTIPLVSSDDQAVCEENGFKYALAYFLKAKERLESDKETFDKFIGLMNDFNSTNHNVVDLYHRIAGLLSQYPDLCEEFLAFLLPEQAIQCEHFMEHLSLAEMMSFLRKIEVFFVKQPQHLRKIYSCWSSLAKNPNLTLDEVRAAIIPLLKGNKLLEDSFVELLPGATPPESKLSYGGGAEVEVLQYEDMDSELSDEERRSERVDVPGIKSDTYGGEHCQCCCHQTDEQAYATRSKHCVPCGMKFIAGKVYLQTEHGLRPVRVNFGSSSSYSNNLKRLNAEPRKVQRTRGPRRSKTSATRQGGPRPPPGPPVPGGPPAPTAAAAAGTPSKDHSPVKGGGKTAEEKDDDSSAKQKSPRCRSKSISSRSKDKQPARIPQQTTGRPNSRAKGKCRLSVFPPAATYDEIALPAPEPTAGKSDATDFSVLSDVLRQEKMDQAKVKDDFQIGSDDSVDDDVGLRPDSAVGSADVIEDGDDVLEEVDVIEEGDVLSDCSDDGDSDEAMSVDSYGESDGDVEVEVESEVEVEGEASSQESEDSLPKAAWTREEDRVILQCFQAAGGHDDSITFAKISELLPSRTIDEIKERFHVLMKLIQQLA